MNKYDELLNTLTLAKDDIVKKISELEQGKAELNQNIEQKEKELADNKKRYEKLNEIRKILENFSFKVPKRFILRRLFGLAVGSIVSILLFFLLSLLIPAIRELFLPTIILSIFIQFLLAITNAFSNLEILKNYKYEDVKKELNNLINNNNELTLALNKDKENMENINERINIEIHKKAEIKAKIKQVYNQKDKVLTSLINASYDKELSHAFDQDDVIKRVLKKEDTHE